MDEVIGLPFYKNEYAVTCWDLICLSKKQWLEEQMKAKRRDDLELLSPKGYCFYIVNGRVLYSD
jgi:hypothetical protein